MYSCIRGYFQLTYKDRKGQTDLNGKNLEGWKNRAELVNIKMER